MKRWLYGLICWWGGAAAHAQAPAAADSAATDSAQYQPGDAERWVTSVVDSAGFCTEVLRYANASGVVRSFYPSGHLKDYQPYADLAAAQLHGVATSWHDNGQLSCRQVFLQGQRDSTLWLYYDNGQLKRQTRYVAGNELPGLCYDPAGTPIQYFPYEQPPLYPGGQAQLVKELSRTIVRQLPPVARFINTGSLTISFQINEAGYIESPQVVINIRKISWLPMGRSIGGSQSSQSLTGILEQERDFLSHKALLALSRITRQFRPGVRDGEVVRWRYQVTIPFSYAVG